MVVVAAGFAAEFAAGGGVGEANNDGQKAVDGRTGSGLNLLARRSFIGDVRSWQNGS